MKLIDIVKMGDALSNPIRIKILYILNEQPRNIYELAKELELSRPVVYAHLRKLEEANLVESDLVLEGSRAKRIYKARDFKFCIDNETIKKLFEEK
ncbi:transcriptional regulator, TrmB [Methanocaldococcus vulcanius M7]|uniref:Transcriptional regulator, TrmB n=1 Tax=Methanocaldococcus vulcanius (strain ATCC 700851 / DSM 12094 / M7) TaxID=579137 RepID=C9RDU5_METVM|nr:winged helix-turn-helix domain-containing protein [Methanocaldococcus vulcanius]ACX73474.1 transcriptional regulator, TrmB [Methanocaldococcus vulcanius M7]